MADKTIGWIGVGIMGEPMARNLLRAGFAVLVHSRTRSRADALVSEGAFWIDSPAELVGKCDVVISCVPDSPDVEAVYLGPRGVCEGVRPGSLCIDMSTISPEVARRVDAAIRGKGGAFLDAPVSGGKTGAHAGTLVIMVGGKEADVQRADPIFRAMGKTIVPCGPVGSGQLTKLCNQILCAVNLLGVCEALVFARKVGLDPERMLQAVSAGAAGSWALSNLGPRMITRDFAPMFMIDLQQKDLRITLQSAAAPNVPLPGTALVSQMLAANQAHGEGREGTQAMIKTLERLAGLVEQKTSGHAQRTGPDVVLPPGKH